jgi:hypothetical protein
VVGCWKPISSGSKLIHWGLTARKSRASSLA